LQGLHCEVEDWRSKYESARLERATLKSEATRVPALAERIEALVAELSQAKADNAQTQAPPRRVSELFGEGAVRSSPAGTPPSSRGGTGEHQTTRAPLRRLAQQRNAAEINLTYRSSVDSKKR
jgi:hypothetical protein